MKLLELRPCIACGGPLIEQGALPMFRVIDVKIALIDAQAANSQLAMTQFFNGNTALGELFGGSNNVVKVDDEHHTRIMVCNECYHSRPMNLQELAEKWNAREEEYKAAQT